MPPTSDDPTYHRIIRVIQGAIRASGRSQIELDRLIGRKDGYLSHVFHGRVQFKVRDLVAVVRELGLDPAAVFGYLLVDETGATRTDMPHEKGRSGQASPGELTRLIAALLDGPTPERPPDSAAAGNEAGANEANEAEDMDSDDKEE